jgi:hypothetical protein
VAFKITPRLDMNQNKAATDAYWDNIYAKAKKEKLQPVVNAVQGIGVGWQGMEVYDKMQEKKLLDSGLLTPDKTGFAPHKRVPSEGFFDSYLRPMENRIALNPDHPQNVNIFKKVDFKPLPELEFKPEYKPQFLDSSDAVHKNLTDLSKQGFSIEESTNIMSDDGGKVDKAIAEWSDTIVSESNAELIKETHPQKFQANAMPNEQLELIDDIGVEKYNTVVDKKADDLVSGFIDDTPNYSKSGYKTEGMELKDYGWKKGDQNWATGKDKARQTISDKVGEISADPNLTSKEKDGFFKDFFGKKKDELVQKTKDKITDPFQDAFKEGLKSPKDIPLESSAPYQTPRSKLPFGKFGTGEGTLANLGKGGQATTWGAQFGTGAGKISQVAKGVGAIGKGGIKSLFGGLKAGAGASGAGALAMGPAGWTMLALGLVGDKLFKEHTFLGKIFSDIALKSNLKRVGKSPSGIPVYQFNYKGSKTKYQGVLAQDVPEATTIHKASGYKMVDYNKIDVNFKQIN